MISVIVPVYKVEQYLDRCIESIVNQTYRDLEIILVDDGSPDNCPAICDRWSKIDSRIKVIHKENGGVSSARNVGLDNADGEYIGFADSDDYLDPKMFELLLNALVSDGSDISVCSSFAVAENGEIKTDASAENKVCSQEEAVKLISYKMNNSLWNKLFRRKVFDGCRFDEGHTFGEDHLILLQALKNTRKVSFINDSLYYYVQRSNSTTGSKFSERSFDQVFMKDALYDFAKENFPYVADYYRKLCFTARENMCRKIILSNCENQYDEKLKEYFQYMKNEFNAVKSDLSKSETAEYKLICRIKPIYKLVFGKILKK